MDIETEILTKQLIAPPWKETMIELFSEDWELA